MASKGPSKAYRKGISLMEAVQMFSDEDASEQTFIGIRWPNGVECPGCGSDEVTIRPIHRKPQQWRCNACRYDFSVRSGTAIESSRHPLSKWAMTVYLIVTSLKGVASMKLHRDIGVTQKTAWHMAHRIREAWHTTIEPFAGTVEADETFVGGRKRNKHSLNRLKNGGIGPGKVVVAGIKNRGRIRLPHQWLAVETQPRCRGSWSTTPNRMQWSTRTTTRPTMTCRARMNQWCTRYAITSMGWRTPMA